MTTTVVLVRHAKPIQAPSQDDFTKPLSEEGKLIQHKMDKYIKYRGIIPDMIWYSPFKRSEETALIISTDFGVAAKEELSLGEFLDEDDLIQKLPSADENMCVFMVGHGPQLMRIATYFAGMQCYPFSPPLSSALILEFENTVQAGHARFVRFFVQEDLVGFVS